MCPVFRRAFLLLLLFGTSALHAQPLFNVHQVQLPRPFTRPIIRYASVDDNGLYYLATSHGLWRFDGTEMQPLDIHQPGVPQNVVPGNVLCYRNFLVINVVGKHLFGVYNTTNGAFKTYPAPSRYTDAELQKDGKLRIYTLDGHGYQLDEHGQLRLIEKIDQMKGWPAGIDLSAVITSGDGKRFIIADNRFGLLSGDSIQWEHPSAVHITGDLNVKQLFFNGYVQTSRYVVIQFRAGFRIYDKQTLKPVFEYHGGDFGVMLAVGDQLTVVRLQGRATGDLHDNALFSVQPQFLPEVAIWALSRIPGTGNSYLIRAANSIFRCDLQNNSSTAPLLSDSLIAQLRPLSIRSIYEQNNRLYAGTYQGFFSIAANQLKKLDDHLIYSMAAMNADSLLLGVEGSPRFLVFNTRTNRIKPLINLPVNKAITRIVPYEGGWICGSDNVLYQVQRLQNGSYAVREWLNDSSLGRVKDILFQHDTCYIGAEGGLFRLVQGKMVRLYEAKEGATCNAVIPYGPGFWIGTYGKGMMLISKQGEVVRRIGYNDGLPGDDVYTLFQYGHLLFAGTDGGLGLFDLANNMIPLLDIPGNNPAALIDQEFNHSAVFFDTLGKNLFMGGLEGIVEIPLAGINALDSTQPQRVILSYVRESAGAKNPLLDLFAFDKPRIIVPSDRSYISIKFAHTTQQTDLLWRIKELNADWQKGNVDRTLDLFSLPPGKYTLEARYPNVLDNRYWLRKTLIIEPHYYQTWWFRALIVLLVLAVIYLIWRIRMQQALEAQRLRTVVASDLHDQIGSALTRISMTSEVLLMKQAPTNPALERISQDSKDAISSISDIIWSIDARNDSWADVIQRMREHAVIMLDENATLNLSVHSSNDQEPVSQQTRQNLYLIFKEAINNVARHTTVNAGVDIQIDHDEKCFVLMISNDITHAGGAKYTGQGLKNMEMRAQRIGARLNITGENGKFVVVLKYSK